MKRFITFTEEQELGLAYVAGKEKLTVDEYIQKVFGAVADKYSKMVRLDEAKIVSENFVKTGVWETDVAVIKDATTVDVVK